jgi:hypothetical protein
MFVDHEYATVTVPGLNYSFPDKNSTALPVPMMPMCSLDSSSRLTTCSLTNPG